METTVESSRQRDALLDESLASTDITQARHQLYQPLEGYNPPKLDQSVVECNKTGKEDTTGKKGKDDHDWASVDFPCSYQTSKLIKSKLFSS